MSNHFTYEIDERNLRLQLKEFTVPVKEEAWQKFETFSDSMVNQHRENRLKNFNFSLNRSVVLPSVFGVIIILFSFLLVNFVSIKNPSNSNDQKAEVSSAVVTMPENQPQTQQAVPASANEKQKDLATATSTIADVKPEEKEMITNLVSVPEASATETVAASVEPMADSVANNTTNDEAKAKRRARRRAEAVESQKLQEIRPTPVSEERDAEEIRPD